MTLPLWGLLQKSQEDSSTIDDAIAAAIVEHEADPTAHLGEGESLEAHKSEGIIDHPPLSVVTDKIPDQSVPPVKFDISGFYYAPSFDSLDSWTVAVNGGGSWLVPRAGIAWFRRGASAAAYARMYQLSLRPVSGSAEPYFQFRLWADNTEEEYADFAAGFTNSTDALSPAGDCFSFFWDASAYKIYARVTDNGVNTDTEITADFVTAPVVFRAEYHYTEKEIHFFVDGTLVYNADVPTLNPQFSDYLFSASLGTGVALETDFYMGNLIVGNN